MTPLQDQITLININVSQTALTANLYAGLCTPGSSLNSVSRFAGGYSYVGDFDPDVRYINSDPGKGLEKLLLK